MDVITNYLLSDNAIEVGLNLVGYLSGGLLWMLIFRKVNDRKAISPIANLNNSDENIVESNISEPVENKHSDVKHGKRTNYVDLLTANNPENKQIETTEPTSSRRRDRSEIIRIAREMLTEGKSKSNIKSSLPISDGELAMLARRGK